MKQLFNDEDSVKIKAQADWKYNNIRGGTTGTIFDVFESDKSGDYVYEVDFGDRGYTLVHQADLESAE